ncbi:MAG: DNA/RNA nuclease SfsA [Rhodothalassiaceae bacterium]
MPNGFDLAFAPPLVPARLVRRYKRFLADVRLDDGEETTAHCANPGSMRGCMTAGARIWLSPNRNPRAKLAWRWELVEVEGTRVGINTARTNRVVEAALARGAIAGLRGYRSLRREVPFGSRSRVDFVLEDPGMCFLEVKNVTLKRDGEAQFPDAVTARGRRHLEDLAAMAAAGHRAVMLYLVQRGDCTRFAIAGDIDPAYAAAFTAARQGGVEMLAYDCTVTTAGVRLNRPLSIHPPAPYLDEKRTDPVRS